MFPFLRDFPSLGYSAVRDVLTVGLQLLAYCLINHIGIPLSSLSPRMGTVDVSCGQRVDVQSLSPSLLDLLSTHPLLPLGAKGIFLNAQNVEKK